jgi:hypothetical protein
VAEHTPILVARNGRLYGKAMGAYELMWGEFGFGII